MTLPKQGHPEPLAQDHGYMTFEDPQELRFHNLSLYYCHPHSKKCFAYFQLELAVFQFVP